MATNPAVTGQGFITIKALGKTGHLCDYTESGLTTEIPQKEDHLIIRGTTRRDQLGIGNVRAAVVIPLR